MDFETTINIEIKGHIDIVESRDLMHTLKEIFERYGLEGEILMSTSVVQTEP